MASYSKEREEFAWRMGTFGLALDSVRKILRHAGTIQRAAEVECSVPLTIEQGEAMEKRVKAARLCIEAEWLDKFKGGRVRVSGDPRGACVKLQRTADDRGDSWGQDGWCVPAHGYTASQMECMTR